MAIPKTLKGVTRHVILLRPVDPKATALELAQYLQNRGRRNGYEVHVKEITGKYDPFKVEIYLTHTSRLDGVRGVTEANGWEALFYPGMTELPRERRYRYR